MKRPCTASLGSVGIAAERQVQVPLEYKGLPLGLRIRLDLLVNRVLIVLTYLRLTSRPVALLVNFNVDLLRNGVRRLLNG